jgi:hypothetical protein
LDHLVGAHQQRGRHRSNESIIIARAVLESAIRDQSDLLAILELRTAAARSREQVAELV